MGAPQLVADPTAVIGRRTVAALIDGAIIIVPGIVIATTSFEYLDVDELGMDPQDWCDEYIDQFDGVCVNAADVNDRVYFSDGAPVGSSLAGWGIAIVLLVLVQGLTGRTVGKLLTGIRTVREDGSVPGIGKALVRWLLLVVDALPCIPLVGFITALTTQGHRRVGDMAAKTFVVRSTAAGRPIAVPGLTVAPGGPGAAGVGDVGYGVGPPTVPTQAPQWDPARGTYIQWDATQQRWLQWDESTRTWSPIPGQ
jgi:uncharacterized RDD family membrane protein YckC